ncbi:MAG: transcription repressor NadR [Firmicutes bacterium]|nr:transcription repressor NadR [Bacillota bacterium]
MKTIERRHAILDILSKAGPGNPVSGSKLASVLKISRQVVVQDIAILRAEQHNIVSTNSGYYLEEKNKPTRVFKVKHTDEQTEDEMNIFVDNGAELVDVFVYHKSYGVVRADMHISSRRGVKEFLASIKSGKSTLLMNITGGYHYHTVTAPDVSILDSIEDQLWEAGYLAELKEYEPVDFRKDKSEDE